MLLPFLLVALALPAAAQPAELPTIESRTQDSQRMDGYFPLYWDEAEGQLLLEIPRLEDDFLYVVSLPAGLGSNDIGLDRGQLGPQRIVRFERVGPRVLLVAPNLDYRAETDNPAEQRSVRDAFAEGVVWGFDLEAATGERLLIDATEFVLRDAHGVVGSLQRAGQGSFRLEESRSALHPSMTKSFPKNTEMEARLTFTSDEPGGQVRQVAADPSSVTLRVRHSFVELPPPGYTPRELDPRSGFFGISYADYSVPIGEDMVKRYVVRHRLEKQNPSAAVSEPVEPIIYYLDPGTPEPVRSALLDGGRWWGEAFEAAGFSNAFRVEMLPEDADPMDVRYNVIQWVHRSTRGWSYGSSVVDPRTGEIIKGHVTLGSLRVRQDYLLAEGLLTPYVGQYEAELEGDDPMLEMALARLRQLSAHEIGHTLGIAHNFAASPNDRASVMDYPAPLAIVASDGSIDLSQAYAEGIGEWDKMAVRYGYSVFPAGVDEPAELRSIIQETRDRGLNYISDADARPLAAAHPGAHLWDNGVDAVESLELEMDVRRAALEQFGAGAIRAGRPAATLEEVLVPLYLRHRYQIDATAKLLGGVHYEYVLREDEAETRPVEASVQHAALAALLEAVQPDVLRLPDGLQEMIPPRPPAFSSHRELFDRRTGVTFDPYAPAETAARMVFDQILQPERAARLAYQKDVDPALPGFRDVLDQVTDNLWKTAVATDPVDAEMQRIAQRAWLDELLAFASSGRLAPRVRATSTHHLVQLRDWLEASGMGTDGKTAASRLTALRDIEQALEQDYDPAQIQRELTVPPGSPIGDNAIPLIGCY